MQRQHYTCPIVKARSGLACGRTSVYADRCGRCSSAARQQVRRSDGRPAPAICECGCGRVCRTSTGFRGDCRPLENARARSARHRDKRLRLADAAEPVAVGEPVAEPVVVAEPVAEPVAVAVSRARVRTDDFDPDHEYIDRGFNTYTGGYDARGK
jgi:hypothetical protein